MTAPATPKPNVARKLIITLILIAVGIFLLFKLIAADDARMTAEAPVTIVSSKPSTEGSGVDVEYSWVVDGKTHTTTDYDNIWFKNVSQYKVCYDPESPGAGSLEPGDKVCGK